MFFKNFPNEKYDFEGQGKFQNIKNIFRSVRALPTFLDEFTNYKLYDIINGERPDIVSSKLYGRPDFYWTFFVINDFLHDGYRAWPLSQEDLLEYFEKTYEGFVITTNPSPTPDSDGLDDYSNNSIAGKFDLGATISGETSGCKGTLIKKDIDMNQLIIQDVTLGTAGIDPISGENNGDIVGGSFIGSGGDTEKEVVKQTSPFVEEKVDTHIVYKYIDAPYKYFLTGDPEKKPVTNRTFIDPSKLDVTPNIHADKVKIAERSGVDIFENRNTTVDENFISFQTYREYENELNDSRSQIRVIDPKYVGQFVQKFKQLINE
tara:strand:- start:2217 stop:3173 length:957 start_codon:yes stop_codon:yes gene_type:complete